MANAESTIGFIVKGPRSRLNEIVRELERDKTVKLVYVKRPTEEGSFLLIIEAKRQSRLERW